MLKFYPLYIAIAGFVVSALLTNRALSVMQPDAKVALNRRCRAHPFTQHSCGSRLCWVDHLAAHCRVVLSRCRVYLSRCSIDTSCSTTELSPLDLSAPAYREPHGLPWHANLRVHIRAESAIWRPAHRRAIIRPIDRSEDLRPFRRSGFCAARAAATGPPRASVNLPDPPLLGLLRALVPQVRLAIR
jgi:hypothetical protein